MANEEFFDSVYTKANRLKDRHIWGSKQAPIVEKSVKYIQEKHVLDLGVGEGKDAIFLTKKGYSVLGVDCSKVGIERLSKNLENENVKIQIKKSNIINFKYPRKYSAIYLIDTLQFLERKHITKVIEDIKSHTLKGGINVIKVVTVKDPQYGKQKDRVFFEIGELKQYYKDWKIVYYEEYISELERHTSDNPPHRHANAEIIAIKI
jgi:tellurite methyltransferase